jgi:hypothetical protein
MTIPDTTTTPGAPAGRTRTDAAVAWTSGHFAELAGITGPLVVSAVTTAWLDLVSVAVAAWWAVHEYRARTARAAIAARALTSTAPRLVVRNDGSTGDGGPTPHRQEGAR